MRRAALVFFVDCPKQLRTLGQTCDLFSGNVPYLRSRLFNQRVHEAPHLQVQLGLKSIASISITTTKFLLLELLF